ELANPERNVDRNDRDRPEQGGGSQLPLRVLSSGLDIVQTLGKREIAMLNHRDRPADPLRTIDHDADPRLWRMHCLGISRLPRQRHRGSAPRGHTRPIGPSYTQTLRPNRAIGSSVKSKATFKRAAAQWARKLLAMNDPLTERD